MTKSLPPRLRKVRVLATLGPASSTPEMIGTLFQAGADAFRMVRCSSRLCRASGLARG